MFLSDIAPKIAGFSIKYIPWTKWWNSLLFYILIQEIKSWLENIGVFVVKSDSDHPGHIVNEEWMDKLSWFFACWWEFTKVKNYFQNFWVILVKNESHPLISEWMSESSYFFQANIYSGKLKVTLIVIVWEWSNMLMAYELIGLYNLLNLKNEWMNWAYFLYAHT